MIICQSDHILFESLSWLEPLICVSAAVHACCQAACVTIVLKQLSISVDRFCAQRHLLTGSKLWNLKVIPMALHHRPNSFAIIVDNQHYY